VIVGANDALVSPDTCKTWATSIPEGRYVELPGANHFFWAKYDDLTRVVTEFLDEVV
jgi:alpha/beta superfamily hydrolase